MQLLTCPFCGPRGETEFHYGGEAGNRRPEGKDAAAQDWAAYLHMRANPRGQTREVWVHLTCREFFVLTRDSITNDVLASEALDAELAP